MLDKSITEHPLFQAEITAQDAHAQLKKNGKVGSLILRESTLKEDYFVIDILTDIDHVERILMIGRAEDEGLISIKDPRTTKPTPLNMTIEEFISNLKQNITNAGLKINCGGL